MNEAEAIADLIHSEDDERARLSSAALSGSLSEMVGSLGADIDSLRVFVEGSIDFSDEDYDFIKEGEVVSRLGDLRQRVINIIDSSLVSSQRAPRKGCCFLALQTQENHLCLIGCWVSIEPLFQTYLELPEI